MAKIKKFGVAAEKEAKVRELKIGPRKNKFVDDKTIAANESIKTNPALKGMDVPHVKSQREPVVPVERKCDVCNEVYNVEPKELIGRTEFWRCDDCVGAALKKIGRRK
jgi:hypothetical protein